ncbi:MAG: GDP-L-fucose synthase [Methyloligellaceae bacterium]
MSHTTQLPELKYTLEGKRIWVAGHRGMVGSALLRRLQQENCEVLTASRTELDLTRQTDVENWLATNKPQAVIIAAAKVGGIHANNIYPAEFLYQNLMIEANIIHAAYQTGIEKLLFLGSSCIYPKFANQPIEESELLTGELEPTNEPYAIAKIAGIKLCQAYRKQYDCDFISAMPTNLYGPGDNVDLETSHVIPALMRKAHEAKQAGDKTMTIWGTGSPKREFMHVDDLSDALVFLMKYYSESQHINIGSGQDISILELTRLINNTTGFTGEIILDTTKPDGTPRKLMQSNKLKNLGWEPNIPLEEGLGHTYNWFTQNR